MDKRGMRFLPCLIALIAFIGSYPMGAHAQDSVINVYVESSVESDDTVGSRLAFQFREQIRRSSAMQLTPLETDAILKINFATLDPTDDRVATVYSIVYSFRDLSDLEDAMWYYLDHTVGICGEDHVASCSESLVALTDDTAEQVRVFIAKMSTYLEEQQASQQ